MAVCSQKMSSFLKRTAAVAVGVAAVFAAGGARAEYSGDYVQKGLIAQWDGYENVGVGVHDGSAAVWKDLVGSLDMKTVLNDSTRKWTDNSLLVDGCTAYGASATAAYRTLEVVYKMTDSTGRILFASGCATGGNHRWVLFDSGAKIYSDGATTAMYAPHVVEDEIKTYSVCYSDSNVPATLATNGVVLASPPTHKNTWDLGDGKVMVGDRAVAGTRFPWRGEVYSIRLYDRTLTPDEIAANHAVDVARFVEGDYSGAFIRVKGSPFEIGSPSPDYGMTNRLVVGRNYTFTCPAVYTNAAADVAATCRGWTFALTNGTETSGSELSKTITYAAETWGATLTWKWDVEYKVTSAAEVTVSSPWAAAGSVVTLTAAPPTGKAVRYWTNTASTVKYTGNPIKVQALGPMTILPVYGRARYAAYGAAGSGASAGDPGDFATLLSSAEAEDVINLASGDYPILKTVSIANGVTVRGAGIGKTILRAASGIRLMTVNHAKAAVEDMTLTDAYYGAWNATGSAIYIDTAGGAVSRVRVTNSTNPDNTGAGVVTVAGPATFSHCIFDNNKVTYADKSTSYGGIVHVKSSSTFDNCLFRDNWNKGSSGTLCLRSGSPIVRNCTIINNRGGYYGGGLAIWASNARVYNTVIAQNQLDGDTLSYKPNVYLNGSWATSCLDYCAVSGNQTCGSHPQLVNAQSFENDGSPAAGSPLVDNGNSARCTAGEVDLSFGRRIIGAAVDIGCYERDTAALGVSFAVSKSVAFVDEEITFTPTTVNASDESTMTWTISNTVTHTVISRNDKAAFTTTLSAGIYNVALKLVDGERTTSFAQASVVSTGPRNLYVVAGENAGAAYPYDTLETAHTNINDAVATALEGAVVHLESPEYTISKTVNVTRPITLKGKGMANTVLRASAAYVKLLYVNNVNASVEDMTFTDASYPSGNVSGSAVTVSGQGGTLRRVRVTNSWQQSNSAGGVVFVEGPAHFSRCIFDNNRITESGNSDSNGGIVRVTYASTFDNCLFCDNWNKGSGGALCLYSGATKVRNCTIVNNRGGYYGGGMYIRDSGVRVHNSVIALNQLDGDVLSYKPNIRFKDDSWASSCLNYCAVSGERTCGSNPQIVTAQSFEPDYSPAAGSTLVNNGDSNLCVEVELDLAGNERIVGANVDIGCYERDLTALGVAFSLSKSVVFLDESVTFTPVIENASADAVATWTISNTVTHAVITRNDKTAFTTTLPAGVFDVSLTVVDGERKASFAQASAVSAGPRNIYVVAGANADAAYPYDTPATAHTNINAAISMALEGAVVHLESPEYTNSQTVVVSQPITLRGKGMNQTILRGKQWVRQMSVNNPKAVVEDLTLADAYYGQWNTTGSALYVDGKGGTFNRIRVTNATHPSNTGAGVVTVNGPAHFSRCVFDNNKVADASQSASYGGLIHVKNAATFDNCFFHDNWNKGSGGTLCLRSGATKVRNCTFVNNRGGYYGGGLSIWDGSARVYNTVIALSQLDGDTLSYKPNVYLKDGSWASSCLNYCAVSGETKCGSNPQLVTVQSFESDYSPAAGSSLVNNGNSNLCVEVALDLAGNERIVGANVDIGCYERDLNALGASFALSKAIVFLDESVTFTPTIENASADAVAAWTISNTVTHAVISRDDKTAFAIQLPAGAYDVTLVVTDGGKSASASTESAVQSGPRNLYVVAGANTDAAYPYDTPATAHTNINDAIAMALEGAVVNLESSEYTNSATIVIERPVTLKGKGMHQTVLRGVKWVRQMYVNSANAVIEDLTLADAYFGQWNAAGSTLLVGGQGCTVNRVRITNSTNPDNTGAGIIRVTGPTHFSHCIFDNNQVTGVGTDESYGGLLVVAAASTFDNCLICDNWNMGARGILCLESGASVVRNCTIVNNRSTYKGGGLYIRDGGARVYNTVIALNQLDSGTSTYAPNVKFFNDDDSMASYCLDYCAVSGDLTCGSHPQLVTAQSFDSDYSPAAGSSLVNNGNSAKCTEGELDLAGKDRIIGDVVDIGCYERDLYVLGVSFTVSKAVVFLDESVTFTPTLENASESATVSWTISNTVTQAVIERSDKTAFSMMLPAGVYDVTIVVTDGGKSASASTASAVSAGPRNVYVVAGENPDMAYPYGTPATAHTNINEAITTAVEGAVVNLESPEYPISETVSVTRPITLRGKGMNTTVLRAAANYVRLLSVNNANATIEDMTFTDAYFPWNYATGSAIYVGGQGAAFNRVRVTNSGHYSNIQGGVVYVEGPTTFSRLVFDHNRVMEASSSDSYGGLFLVKSASTFDNCLFCCNTNMGSRGVLCLDSASRVRNCTIVDNRCGYYGGGLYVRNGGARVYNTVIALNQLDHDTSSYAPNVRFSDDSYASSCLDYCAVSGSRTCGSHPQLVTADDFPRASRMNYRMSPSSACINNGTLTCWGTVTGVVDLEGRPRLQRGKIDIGAYEGPLGGFTLIVR